MKTKNRLFTIIALSTFVLSYILPLHNAISHCVEDSMYNSISLLESLVVHRQDKVKDAEDDLADKENNDLLDSILGAATIGGMTGGFLGAIASVATVNPLPMFLGPLGGVTTGTIAAIQAHYKAIDDAKEALKTAKEKLAHAQAKLDAAKQGPANVTIAPRESHISIYYTPTHHIDISSDKPIDEIKVSIKPVDDTITGNDSSYTISFPNGETYSTTISETFSRYDYKGKYKVEITVTTHGKDDSVNHTYEISVDQ